jgi:integrase
LRWRDVSLKAGTVTVATQRTTDAQGHVVETEAKGTSRRTIDVGRNGVEAVVAHRARQERERAAWGDGWTDTGYVFVQENGLPYHPARITELFQALAARAGVQVIRLHDGRHTCATLALDAGVHPKVVQELLGHSSYAITMDLYSHRVRRLQRDVTSRIEVAIFGEDKAG